MATTWSWTTSGLGERTAVKMAVAPASPGKVMSMHGLTPPMFIAAEDAVRQLKRSFRTVSVESYCLL